MEATIESLPNNVGEPPPRKLRECNSIDPVWRRKDHIAILTPRRQRRLTSGTRRLEDGVGQRTGKKMSVRHLDWSGSAAGSFT